MRRLDFARLAAYVILIGFVTFGFFRLQTSLDALCALRVDLDKRISSSKEFLAKHPNGIPGISASVIRQSLKNSERTRKALNVLSC